MLNDVDVDGIRRIAATLRQDSWEAQLSAEVEAGIETGSGGAALLATRPMRFGSVRVARPFQWRASPDGTAPVETVLTALGGCVSAATATVLTERGHAPEGIVVTAEARLGPDPHLSYTVDISGDVPEDEGKAVMDHVRRRSVAHRTLEDPNEVWVGLPASEDSRLMSHQAGDPDLPEEERRVRAVWAVAMRSQGPELEIDQPRQLFGHDRAPSPQEYLLAAAAQECLAVAGGGSANEGGWTAHSTGRVDLRGCFGVTEGSVGGPVGVRNLLVQLVPGDGVAVRAAPDLDRWRREGPVLRLLRNAVPVHPTVRFHK